MTLIVEDGTIVAGAESYISVSDADAYFTARGKSATWGAVTATKEQMLRLATDYMCQVYRYRWAGYRYSLSQALDWPRIWVPIYDEAAGYGPFPAYIANNIVPTEVKNACAEFAYRQMSTGDLAPDLTPEDMANRVKIGQLEIQYNAASPVTIFRAADAMLKPYLTSGAGSTRLVRT